MSMKRNPAHVAAIFARADGHRPDALSRLSALRPSLEASYGAVGIGRNGLPAATVISSASGAFFQFEPLSKLASLATVAAFGKETSATPAADFLLLSQAWAGSAQRASLVEKLSRLMAVNQAAADGQLTMFAPLAGFALGMRPGSAPVAGSRPAGNMMGRAAPEQWLDEPSKPAQGEGAFLSDDALAGEDALGMAAAGLLGSLGGMASLGQPFGAFKHAEALLRSHAEAAAGPAKPVDSPLADARNIVSTLSRDKRAAGDGPFAKDLAMAAHAFGTVEGGIDGAWAAMAAKGLAPMPEDAEQLSKAWSRRAIQGLKKHEADESVNQMDGLFLAFWPWFDPSADNAMAAGRIEKAVHAARFSYHAFRTVSDALNPTLRRNVAKAFAKAGAAQSKAPAAAAKDEPKPEDPSLIEQAQAQAEALAPSLVADALALARLRQAHWASEAGLPKAAEAILAGRAAEATWGSLVKEAGEAQIGGASPAARAARQLMAQCGLSTPESNAALGLFGAHAKALREVADGPLADLAARWLSAASALPGGQDRAGAAAMAALALARARESEEWRARMEAIDPKAACEGIAGSDELGAAMAWLRAPRSPKELAEKAGFDFSKAHGMAARAAASAMLAASDLLAKGAGLPPEGSPAAWGDQWDPLGASAMDWRVGELVRAEGFQGRLACLAQELGRAPSIKAGASAREAANAWLGAGRQAALEAFMFGEAGWRHLRSLPDAVVQGQWVDKARLILEAKAEQARGRREARAWAPGLAIAAAARFGQSLDGALEAESGLAAISGQLGPVAAMPRHWWINAWENLAGAEEGMASFMRSLAKEESARESKKDLLMARVLGAAGELGAERLADAMLETRDWIDAEAGQFWARVPKGASWKWFAGGNELWHDQQALKSMPKGVAWAPVLGVWRDSGGGFLRAMELCSPAALVEEGAQMSHCVGSYASQCSSGHSSIFSIQEPGGKRVGTLQLSMDAAAGEFRVAQLRGKFNAEVSSDARKAGGSIAAAANAALKAAAKAGAGKDPGLSGDLPGFEAFRHEARARGADPPAAEQAADGVPLELGSDAGASLARRRAAGMAAAVEPTPAAPGRRQAKAG